MIYQAQTRATDGLSMLHPVPDSIAPHASIAYTRSMPTIRFLLPLLSGMLLTLAPLLAHADIYKYVDADGNVTFTDRYRPGAQKVISDFGPARGHADQPKKKRAASNPSPASFPKVSTQTQRQRDDLRKQILLDERDHENRLLGEARTALAALAGKPSADLTSLKEAVHRHQQNLGMLDKELSRLK